MSFGQLATTVAPYAIEAVKTVAPHAVNYAVNAATQYFTQPQYGTGQADAAMRGNVNYTQNQSRGQNAYEDTAYRNRTAYDQQMLQAQQQFTAGMANAASNANTARNMALNAQEALNSMYTSAGDRLNNAAGSMQQALNQTAAIAAGMFR